MSQDSAKKSWHGFHNTIRGWHGTLQNLRLSLGYGPMWIRILLDPTLFINIFFCIAGQTSITSITRSCMEERTCHHFVFECKPLCFLYTTCSDQFDAFFYLEIFELEGMGGNPSCLGPVSQGLVSTKRIKIFANFCRSVLMCVLFHWENTEKNRR